MGQLTKIITDGQAREREIGRDGPRSCENNTNGITRKAREVT